MQPAGARLRLSGMRCVPWFAGILLFVAGCGEAEVPCTMIGTRAGIGLDIPSATGITRATLEACWHGQCVDAPVRLQPATAPGATTCANGVCSAPVTGTGGLQGFVDLPALTAEPVRVTVRFDDGEPHTTDVTPAFTEPNGPGCGKAGPQAQLVVGAGRELRPR
jgi:hypothetical protein